METKKINSKAFSAPNFNISVFKTEQEKEELFNDDFFGRTTQAVDGAIHQFAANQVSFHEFLAFYEVTKGPDMVFLYMGENSNVFECFNDDARIFSSVCGLDTSVIFQDGMDVTLTDFVYYHLNDYLCMLVDSGYRVVIGFTENGKFTTVWYEKRYPAGVSDAIKYICRYMGKEFGTLEALPFKDLEDIKVAYTEKDNGKFAIQTSIDLINYKIIYKVNDKLICKKTFHSPNPYTTMAQDLKKHLNFQSLTDPASFSYPIVGVQIPGEDGLVGRVLKSLIDKCTGYYLDVLRIDGDNSSAFFVCDSEIYGEWECSGILEEFKKYVRSVLNDAETETESGLYSFDDIIFNLHY